MTDSINCKQCDTSMRQESLGFVAGEEGVLKISVADFPALVCERGHRQFVSRDFPMQFLEQVASDNRTGLPKGKKLGLLFKKYQCGKCGEVLAKDSESRPFGFDVQLADLPKMRVEFTVPVYKCPSCGLEQLRANDEIVGLVPAALAHAFQSAGIKPLA